MPARSRVQQMAAGAALFARRGDIEPKRLKGASRTLYRAMSEQQLRELAATRRRDKPRRARRK